MTPPRARHVSPLLLALVLACGGDAETEQPTTDARAAADAPQMGQSNEADIEEVADYRLTLDAVEKMHQAQLNIYAAMQRNPQIAQMASMGAEEFSLDALEARFNDVPEVRNAVESAGLSVREYGVVMLALFQASFAQASLDMGADRDEVLAATGMRPENLDFVAHHRDDLRRMQDQLEAVAQEADETAQ